MGWEDEEYLMYFFHSKLLFVPVLWKERSGEEGERMKRRVRKAHRRERDEKTLSETEGDT